MKPLQLKPTWSLFDVARWAEGETKVEITLNCDRTVEGYILDVTNHIIMLTSAPAGGGTRFIPFHAMSMIRVLA